MWEVPKTANLQRQVHPSAPYNWRHEHLSAPNIQRQVHISAPKIRHQVHLSAPNNHLALRPLQAAHEIWALTLYCAWTSWCLKKQWLSECYGALVWFPNPLALGSGDIQLSVGEPDYGAPANHLQYESHFSVFFWFGHCPKLVTGLKLKMILYILLLVTLWWRQM